MANLPNDNETQCEMKQEEKLLIDMTSEENKLVIEEEKQVNIAGDIFEHEQKQQKMENVPVTEDSFKDVPLPLIPENEGTNYDTEKEVSSDEKSIYFSPPNLTPARITIDSSGVSVMSSKTLIHTAKTNLEKKFTTPVASEISPTHSTYGTPLEEPPITPKIQRPMTPRSMLPIRVTPRTSLPKAIKEDYPKLVEQSKTPKPTIKLVEQPTPKSTVQRREENQF